MRGLMTVERTSFWNRTLAAGCGALLVTASMSVPAVWRLVERWGPVVRDLLSVGLAGLGAYLAWLSIQMGREQDVITAKQIEIMRELAKTESLQASAIERLLAITDEQLKITHRQLGATSDVWFTYEKIGDGMLLLEFMNRGAVPIPVQSWWITCRSEGLVYRVLGLDGKTVLQESSDEDLPGTFWFKSREPIVLPPLSTTETVILDVCKAPGVEALPKDRWDLQWALTSDYRNYGSTRDEPDGIDWQSVRLRG